MVRRPEVLSVRKEDELVVFYLAIYGIREMLAVLEGGLGDFFALNPVAVRVVEILAEIVVVDLVGGEIGALEEGLVAI